MRPWLRKPFLLGLILALPLWLVLHNFIVAVSVGLLMSFLGSMVDAIVTLRNAPPTPPSAQPDPDTSPPPHDADA